MIVEFADTFIVFALTDKSKGPKGMSAFIVEREFEGLSVGPNIERMGIRAASNCEVIYENVKVPAENLLGKEGQGYKIVPNHFLLVPGIGAQGGSLEEVCKYGMNNTCGLIVNSSRAIIYADKTENFANVAGQEAKKVQAQMEEQLKAIL